MAAEQRSSPVMAPTTAPAPTAAEQRSSPVMAPAAAPVTIAAEQRSSPIMVPAASSNVFVNIYHLLFCYFPYTLHN